MATPANKLSVRSNAGKGSAKSPKPVVERVACSVVEHATRSVPPTIALTTPFIKLEAPNGARAGRRKILNVWPLFFRHRPGDPLVRGPGPGGLFSPPTRLRDVILQARPAMHTISSNAGPPSQAPDRSWAPHRRLAPTLRVVPPRHGRSSLPVSPRSGSSIPGRPDRCARAPPPVQRDSPSASSCVLTTGNAG